MKRLSGRYAVVTGGGKGIGAAIVQRFAAEGAAGAAILDYDIELAKKTAAEVGGNVIAVQCDVSKEDQVHTAVADVIAAFGRIDILVNNAAITRDAMFHKMTRDAWDAVLKVNLDGPYNLCREIYPLMRAREYGRIVNIASTSAFGNVGQANYAAAKAALLGFTKTLAREGAQKNIVANVLAPGYINTDMFQAVPQEIIDDYLCIIPMGRLGKPEEIAGVAAFLASDDVSFLTGQCLIVSGGAQT